MLAPNFIVPRPHALPVLVQWAISYGDGSITCNPSSVMSVGFHISVPSVAQDIMGGQTYPVARGNLVDARARRAYNQAIADGRRSA